VRSKLSVALARPISTDFDQSSDERSIVPNRTSAPSKKSCSCAPCGAKRATSSKSPQPDCAVCSRLIGFGFLETTIGTHKLQLEIELAKMLATKLRRKPCKTESLGFRNARCINPNWSVRFCIATPPGTVFACNPPPRPLAWLRRDRPGRPSFGAKLPSLPGKLTDTLVA
jgi:hypothetical protein